MKEMKNNIKISNSNRIVGLDLLRISLALLIYLFHSQMHFQCHYGVMDSFISMGAIAMTAFFMLSGYSLGISNSNHNFSDFEIIKVFYIKRLISIVPLYMFIHIVRMFVFNNEPVMNRILMFPIQTLGIQSQFSTLFGHVHNGGSWFISCLLMCYFVFPLIHILFSHLSKKQTIGLLLLLIFIMFWSPLVKIKLETNSIYDNPFFRCIEFSIGLLLFNFSKSIKNSKSYDILTSWMVIVLIVFVLLGGVMLAVRLGFPRDYMLFNWIALPCFIMLILGLGNHYIFRLQGSSLIKFASGLSFTFFLAQMLGLWQISGWVVDVIGYDNNIIRIVVSFIVCLVIAIFLHEVVEIKSSQYLKYKLLK